ncbi:MAG: SprB repeat-containing protein, partial [Bacteroidota bacterium]|nr:SprB repeat-containing protein [Bacteroidota bacterium]
MRKKLQQFRLSLLAGLLLLGLTGYSQTAKTTYDFSTAATLSGITNGWPWNTQADITIGGVAYRLTSGGNGSFTNVTSGGSSNSQCLQKDGSGGDYVTLQRTDGQPFQFYGIWVKHQSMNQYSTMIQLPPWYTLTASTFSFQDNTAMTPGTNWNNYTGSEQSISAGTAGITTSSVQINFQAILYYLIDNIIVGPAPVPLSATTSQTNVSCNGGVNGSARVIVSGGTPSYTYSWSPSGGTASAATGLAAGNYTCTITDGANNKLSKSFTITQPTALTTAIGTQTNVTCNGGSNGSVTVNTTGGTPSYTYSWSPSGGTDKTATGLTAGTYTCTVTDANGC